MELTKTVPSCHQCLISFGSCSGINCLVWVVLSLQLVLFYKTVQTFTRGHPWTFLNCLKTKGSRNSRSINIVDMLEETRHLFCQPTYFGSPTRGPVFSLFTVVTNARFYKTHVILLLGRSYRSTLSPYKTSVCPHCSDFSCVLCVCAYTYMCAFVCTFVQVHIRTHRGLGFVEPSIIMYVPTKKVLV